MTCHDSRPNKLAVSTGRSAAMGASARSNDPKAAGAALGLILVLSLCAGRAWAKELLPDGWKFQGENDKDVPFMFDRDIQTAWRTPTPQKDGVGFTIDFSKTAGIHRLILDPGQGENLFQLPRSLRLLVGESLETLKVFLEADYSTATLQILDLQFNAVQGRFLGVRIGAQGSGFPWSVAEMRIYGFDEARKLRPRDAVVLPDGLPECVNIAAREMSYYLGEIAGRPTPVVKPAEAAGYPGTQFVVDQAPGVELPTPEIVPRYRQSVHVYRKGREVHFGGRTHQAVMYGMFEFLDRQGVRWLYPSVYGDCILRRGKVKLSVLPIAYTPPIECRMFQGYLPAGHAARWFPHTHWNKCFNTWPADHLMGGEAYRNNGHHSFYSLVPGKLYDDHSEWFPMLTDEKWKPSLATQGYRLGQRIPYSTGGSIGFCTSNPGVRDYIALTALQDNRKDPARCHSVRVGQMDAARWCECPACLAQDEKAVTEDYAVNPPARSKSERFFDLAKWLGLRLKELSPQRPIQVATFAYSDAMHPPVTIPKLPDNVSVDVVLSGSFRVYLPPSAPQNQELVRRLRLWRTKTDHLGIYTWDLLCPGARIPLVYVTGAAEWFKLWKELDVENVMPEASSYPEAVWSGNPWCYYVYGRLAWRPDETAEQLFVDFFSGYFQEAAEPMLAYYRTLEDHVRRNNLTYGSTWQPQVTREMFPPEVLKPMARHLREAETAAKHYVTKARVQGIRSGFDMVLKALDIKPEVLQP